MKAVPSFPARRSSMLGAVFSCASGIVCAAVRATVMKRSRRRVARFAFRAARPMPFQTHAVRAYAHARLTGGRTP